MRILSGAQLVLERGLGACSYSAVSAEVGRADGPVWTYASGAVSFQSGAPVVDASTIFDLASLTKVLATTTIALALVVKRGLDIEMRMNALVPDWTKDDRTDVTLRDCLEHCSGLPGHRDYFRRISGRDAYARAIANEPLEYLPRGRSVYSDLGFIMLGFALERFAGRSLDDQFREWRSTVGVNDPLTYRPPAEWRWRTAATEEDAWRGRLLQGEVHDENAAALGGAAAHAGLFGNVAAVGHVGRWWLRLLQGRNDAVTDEQARHAAAFVQPSTVPGSSRALGWDTMRPTSSCGRHMSARAVGHTGFTGTSLWLDPEQNTYFVLLTNRVHPTRQNDTIQQIRREFHDAAVTDLTRCP